MTLVEFLFPIDGLLYCQSVKYGMLLGDAAQNSTMHFVLLIC